MKIFFGILMAAVGFMMFICSKTKSQNKIFQVLIARSRIIWKDNVYFFVGGIGIIIAVLGILYAIQFVWA